MNKSFLTLLLFGTVAAFFLSARRAWAVPDGAKKYLNYFYESSGRHGVPVSLLLRVAEQESKFRNDIISGDVISSAGAVGIMQIVPRWHPDVDPLNIRESIDYAAKYLAGLKNRFGSWEDALAAYNWGQGNLAKYKSGSGVMPAETKNYVSEILNDVGNL